jgi:hypothetical protein
MNETEFKFDETRDNEYAIDNEIAPLMKKILRICHARGIPVVGAFQFSPDQLYTCCVLDEKVDPRLFAMAAIIHPADFVYTPENVSSTPTLKN